MTQQISGKRHYAAPKLIVHGTMQELTAAGFSGPDDNAYSGFPGAPGGNNVSNPGGIS